MIYSITMFSFLALRASGITYGQGTVPGDFLMGPGANYTHGDMSKKVPSKEAVQKVVRKVPECPVEKAPSRPSGITYGQGSVPSDFLMGPGASYSRGNVGKAPSKAGPVKKVVRKVISKEGPVEKEPSKAGPVVKTPSKEAPKESSAEMHSFTKSEFALTHADSKEMIMITGGHEMSKFHPASFTEIRDVGKPTICRSTQCENMRRVCFNTDSLGEDTFDVVLVRALSDGSFEKFPETRQRVRDAAKCMRKVCFTVPHANMSEYRILGETPQGKCWLSPPIKDCIRGCEL